MAAFESAYFGAPAAKRKAARKRRRARMKKKLGTAKFRKRMFSRLVDRYVKAKEDGNTEVQGKVDKRIQQKIRRKPALAKTKAGMKYLAARGGTAALVNSEFEPSTGVSAADSPEGEVVDGFGAYNPFAGRSDGLQKFLIFGGYAALAAGFLSKGKTRKSGYTAGIGMLAAAFVRSQMSKKDDQIAQAAGFSGFGAAHAMANPHCPSGMGGYGELEIMDGFGELEVMDGYGGAHDMGAMHENPMHTATYGAGVGGVAAFGGYGAYGVRDFDMEEV
jgi:hypothetical protein